MSRMYLFFLLALWVVTNLCLVEKKTNFFPFYSFGRGALRSPIRGYEAGRYNTNNRRLLFGHVS